MMDDSPTIETRHRLNIWRTHAQGNYSEYCINGANDGVEFYKKNQHDMTELKKSFRWDWLRNYFDRIYG